jgi:hypothetical protein
MTALNDLEVKVGNVLNACITAPITKKVWTVLGSEFGSDAGKSAIIMQQMGYTSCKANPDLWYKAETRPIDNFRYHAYILFYVDDILCMHHDPMTILD